MNNHQSLKAEIDAREDNFTACVSLGKELLARNHYASADIKEKLLALTNHRNTVLHRWEERWENLQLSKYNYYKEYNTKVHFTLLESSLHYLMPF